MTIKHSHHPADVDRPGTDSWRHFNEGRAERSLIAAPDLRVLFERAPDDYDPVGPRAPLPGGRRHRPRRGLQAGAAAQDRGVPAARWRRPRSSTPPRPTPATGSPSSPTIPIFEADLPGAPLPRHDVAPAARHPRHGSARQAIDGERRRSRPREAARRILDDVRRQPALRVPLDDALDSVLAEDVVSPLDIPAWTNSAMDGYAARADDVRGASAEAPGAAPRGRGAPGRARSPPAGSGRASAPASSPARRSPTAPTASSGRRTPTRARRRVTIVQRPRRRA